jgi:drug/metabolite transporter (DMT)-like permease
MNTPTATTASPAEQAGAESADLDGNARTRRAHLASAVLTFVVIAASSLCFCAKGIFIKIGYRDGLDTVTVLMLRNLLALPFFLGGLVWSEWRARRTGAGPLSRVDFWRVLALGFVGYYVSSLINFLGLQHVSVGLERMILYTYPSMVMLGSAYFFRQKIKPAAVAALGVAYAGLALGFWGELQVGPQGNLPLGAALVFGSALTYAAFTVVSGEMVQRLGATRLMSWALVASAVMVLIHYAVTHRVSSLAALPGPAWELGATLALVGTVIPSYLFGWGLQRAGATASAVIGMVGPVGTVALAATMLGERVTFMQLAGLALTLGGGVAMSLLKRATPAPGSPPRG